MSYNSSFSSYFRPNLLLLVEIVRLYLPLNFTFWDDQKLVRMTETCSLSNKSLLIQQWNSFETLSKCYVTIRIHGIHVRDGDDGTFHVKIFQCGLALSTILYNGCSVKFNMLTKNYIKVSSDIPSARLQ